MVNGRRGETQIAQWLSSQIGDDKRFRSARQFAEKAGLNQNTVKGIIRRGRGQPETILALADAAEVNPVDLYYVAGWLTPAHVNGTSEDHPRSFEEVLLLRAFRAADPLVQKVILSGLHVESGPMQEESGIESGR